MMAPRGRPPSRGDRQIVRERLTKPPGEFAAALRVVAIAPRQQRFELRRACAEALEADRSRKADDAMDQLPGGGTRGRVAGRSGHDQRFERTVYHGYVIGGESHWP